MLLPARHVPLAQAQQPRARRVYECVIPHSARRAREASGRARLPNGYLRAARERICPVAQKLHVLCLAAGRRLCAGSLRTRGRGAGTQPLGPLWAAGRQPGAGRAEREGFMGERAPASYAWQARAKRAACSERFSAISAQKESTLPLPTEAGTCR